MRPPLSVIVPTLNEGGVIAGLLAELQPLRTHGCELLVSDGGSSDATLAVAQGACDQLITGQPGRAAQMNRAAALAQGEWLWFVHADTRFTQPPLALLPLIQSATTDWGFCYVRLDAPGRQFRLIAALMNRRSRLSRVATGDQGLFVRRKVFEQLGGFAAIPLMEDIELSKRLRRRGRPLVLRSPLLTSARRWQRDGVLATVLLMWRLRLAYFLGVSPERLAQYYRLCSSPTQES